TITNGVAAYRVQWQFANLFKRWADVGCLLGFRVDNPKDFLDVVSHLTEALLAFSQTGLLFLQLFICSPHLRRAGEQECLRQEPHQKNGSRNRSYSGENLDSSENQ